MQLVWCYATTLDFVQSTTVLLRFGCMNLFFCLCSVSQINLRASRNNHYDSFYNLSHSYGWDKVGPELLVEPLELASYAFSTWIVNTKRDFQRQFFGIQNCLKCSRFGCMNYYFLNNSSDRTNLSGALILLYTTT